MADSPVGGIAIFLGELSGGGAEKVMVTLANGIARRGHRVDLVLAVRRGPFLADVAPGVDCVDLEAGGTLRALPRLVTYLRRRRPEAVLTTLHHTSLIALWAKWLAGSQARLYMREANTPSAEQPATPRGRLLSRAARYAYPAADGVIAVSEGVAEDLRRLVPRCATRLNTIYNPVVGPELFSKSRCRAEHRWFEEAGMRVILAAGRLTVQKDFATLIRAFATLQDPDLRLLILGEGEERERLQELVAALRLTERVELPGFVSNPYAYMARASLFVLSSRWEGMPGVLIQAMACGCPVVSTDCPSGPSEVLNREELVPVGDHAALARAMERRLAAPAQRASVAERVARFSEEESIDAYLALLLGKRTDSALLPAPAPEL
ncbi:MAG TPA: glycosyltransferase [Trueperaceae bacterium]